MRFSAIDGCNGHQPILVQKHRGELSANDAYNLCTCAPSALTSPPTFNPTDKSTHCTLAHAPPRIKSNSKTSRGRGDQMNKPWSQETLRAENITNWSAAVKHITTSTNNLISYLARCTWSVLWSLSVTEGFTNFDSYIIYHNTTCSSRSQTSLMG